MEPTTSNAVGIVVKGFEFFAHWTKTRFPFRYGIASMTEVPHLFVQVRVEVGGKPAVGLASEGLPPKWFTKDPTTTFERDLADMFAVIRHASELAVAVGRHASSYFDWWREVERNQAMWAAQIRFPMLLAGLGVSLCERAVLDGMARAQGTPLHALVRDNRLGIRLGEVYASLGRAEPRDLLPPTPLARVSLRHTLGLTDALTPADLPDAERVSDGLPQDLEGCIQAYGLRCFKVKLTGQSDRDLPRLGALQALLQRRVRGDCLVTLDANENFKDFGAFEEFWRRVQSDHGLAWLLKQVALIEQPVHRDHALDEQAASVLQKWRDHPPLVIDESDGALDDLPRALGLGYAGASHKNCKGILKGIAHACLLEHRRRSGRLALLTGEDLCNLGPVALLQDLAVMAFLGVPHVERNGHHYFRGLTPWPDEWQEITRSLHPDLYIRDPNGVVRLNVVDGEVHLDTLNAAPFGLAPRLDPSRFSKVTALGEPGR